MIRTLHEGLLAECIAVSIAWLGTWFGVPRRTVYDKPIKSAPKVDPRFGDPIMAMIEEDPSFGYRTVAWMLGFKSEAPNATGPSERAERRSSGSSSSRAGRFVSAPWVRGPASRPSLPSLQPQTNASSR